MTLSASEQCRSCLATLQEIISILSRPDHVNVHVKHAQINEELDRFSLFVGNIGALHRPESSMSIESRLHKANEVLTHILDLLADLNEVATELLDIVSGKREGSISVNEQINDEISEVQELREEISGTITRLFRISILIRQAAPTDLFAQALSRNRYCSNDQFDIAHVGEKYRKLGTNDCAWLRQRLGRAITHRRHYLSYIRDQQEKLGGKLSDYDKAESSVGSPQAPDIKQSPASKFMLDSVGSDSEDDARSYTTISRSVDDDHESCTTVRIPKLDDLRIGEKKEIECPFCFRIKEYKQERTWRKHVFSDLRAYVCTFPNCDAPYFGDINEWFQHEMMFHRVFYECFLCPSTVFYQEESYLSHVKRKHVELLYEGEEQPVKDLARKPLAQIPVDDCPCCSNWADRLKERTAQKGESLSNDALAVVPAVFKRHLASHLEQLALFAVSIDGATDDNTNSDAAIEKERSKRIDASEQSALTFASSRSVAADAGPDGDPSTSEALCAHVQDTRITAGPENDALDSLPSKTSKLGDIHGVDQSSFLAELSILSKTFRDEHEWQDAESVEVQVLEMSKEVLGSEHPDTLASMHNLALALEEQGKYAEAEVMYTETSKEYEKVLGHEHPSALTSMSHLVRVLGRQGKYKEAEPVQRQVLATNERVLGEYHADTLMNIVHLGNLCASQERFDEAEKMFLRALEGKEEVLGPDHSSTLDTANNLGNLYVYQGHFNEAKKMFLRVLQGKDEVLGPEHPSTLNIVDNLGYVYKKLGRLEEAERLYQRAAGQRKRRSQSTHQHLTMSTTVKGL